MPGMHTHSGCLGKSELALPIRAAQWARCCALELAGGRGKLSLDNLITGAVVAALYPHPLQKVLPVFIFTD
jgi:hypothetical protein